MPSPSGSARLSRPPSARRATCPIRGASRNVPEPHRPRAFRRIHPDGGPRQQRRSQDPRRPFRARLMSAGPAAEHPGVFPARGETGIAGSSTTNARSPRALETRVVSASSTRSPPRCGYRRGLRGRAPGIIAGVEGSQLVHGLMVMAPEATLLVLQPPDRAVLGPEARHRPARVRPSPSWSAKRATAGSFYAKTTSRAQWTFAL